MIYRLKELQGDTIAVPQLVFSKLGIAEEYNVRVALYVLATGITDPDKICADLKLRSRISAESALSFWAGAGLLERYEENAAPGAEPSAPAPMTWAEIAAASRTDPMISSLIDCAQTGFARPLTHSEMEKLVNLYVQEGFAPETVMLCVAYVASRGKRTMAAVLHELKVWRAEGVETGEQADAHLKLLALRQTREQYVASLLGIPDSELTLGGRKAIARWYEAGLANSDRIHLTHEGYRLQGELLCDALIRAYNDYKGFSGNSAIAPNTHLIEKLPQIPLDEVVSTPQKQQ